MSERELEISHEGEDYIVTVEIKWEYEDTSFAGHLYGRNHIFKEGHWFAEDYEIVRAVRLTEDDEEEVDVSSVKGLKDKIDYAVEDEHYD